MILYVNYGEIKGHVKYVRFFLTICYIRGILDYCIENTKKIIYVNDLRSPLIYRDMLGLRMSYVPWLEISCFFVCI